MVSSTKRRNRQFIFYGVGRKDNSLSGRFASGPILSVPTDSIEKATALSQWYMSSAAAVRTDHLKVRMKSN
jgi:hypothetical protein